LDYFSWRGAACQIWPLTEDVAAPRSFSETKINSAEKMTAPANAIVRPEFRPRVRLSDGAVDDDEAR
jgi:hypothetical protein